MKTDDLITLLANGTEATERHAVGRRLTVAVLIGAMLALALVAGLFGINPALPRWVGTPLFWWKPALPALLLIVGLACVGRLARPGGTPGRLAVVLLVPAVVMWVAALYPLSTVPAAERPGLILGQTWRTCALNIAMLSLPAFAASVLALRQLAPTRPRAAGAAAGLVAGAIATLAYSLHCPEMAPPFWAIWYLLGMAIPVCAGALLGPRLLRW
ncbi:NrsF family protein [Alloalcanivorax sp. C16-1]|uniref:NrsF family protein n=1 Tax=Alloalcanivorax sp. C16-1 TaxID=3390051 RepID=UPI00397105CF